MRMGESWPPTHIPWSPLTNGTPTDCAYEHHVEYVLYVTTMVTAATIVILLNFTQRRSEYCKNFLWGIPGLAIPVNLLSSTPFRVIYCIILSCLAADLLQNVLDKSLYFRADNGLLDAFHFFVASPAVMILSQALAYFPVFACVDTPLPFLGHSIGFIYTCLLAASNIYSEAVVVKGCSYRGQLCNRDIGISLAVVVPVYLLYLVIAGWFLCHAAMEIVICLFTGQSHHVCEHNDFEIHVKSLFKKQVRISRQQMQRESLWNYLVRGLKFVLPYNSNFRYPLPFVGALCMSYIVLYQLVVSWTSSQVIFGYKLLGHLESFNTTVRTIEKLFPSTAGRLNLFYEDVLQFGKAVTVILPVGSVVGYGLCVSFTLYMVQTFHKKLLRAAHGDKLELIGSEPLPSLTYRLAASMRYSAFQVAYLVFTWMLYTLCLWVLLTIGLFFYYAFKDFTKLGIHIWAFFMVPMMWGAAAHLLQLVLCKYVFLDKGSGQFVVIRYRRLYQLMTYFLFFFNVIFGIVMCFLRVFGVFMFTMAMLFRIDHDVYMRGLEGWDTGNRTFVGYIYLECTYNNAVLRVFVKLMLDAARQRQKRPTGRRPSTSGSVWSIQSDMYGSSNSEDSKDQTSLLNPHPGSLSNKGPLCSPRANSPDRKPMVSQMAHNYSINAAEVYPQLVKSRRACNRWLVAFTLIRNPSLQGLTASRLQARTAHVHQAPFCQHGGCTTYYGTM